MPVLQLLLECGERNIIVERSLFVNIMAPSCPPPRLCQMTKWDHFDGYGFNLHADKNRSGQFVGLIDPGSPAEASGLREGDRIVEVNGVNVTHDNHKHVVVRIKSNPSSTTMLVCDKDCDAYHREHGLIVTSCLPYILHMSSNTDMCKDGDTLDTRHQIEDIVEEKVN